MCILFKKVLVPKESANTVADDKVGHYRRDTRTLKICASSIRVDITTLIDKMACHRFQILNINTLNIKIKWNTDE